VGFLAVLLLVACGLIFHFARQKEDEQPAVAQQEKVKVKFVPKSSRKATKGIKSREVTTAKASLPGRPHTKKGISEYSSRDEKTGKTMDKETVEALDPAERVLRPDLSEEERSAAVEELERMDHATIIETVIKALDSPSPEVRQAALDALWEVDDEAVNTPLMKALEDVDADVRESAMDVMDQLESPNTLPSLERALTDSDADIREQALSILEDIPDHRAVDLLIEQGLQHDDESIREDTLDSLEFITDQDFDRWEEAVEWWYRNRDDFVFD
jgi:HEAT repeat protein